MEIRRYVSGLLESNMYLISENGHAVVIDPSEDTSVAEGMTVDLILITHEHYDHISGVNAWKEKYAAPLLCSEACAACISSPRKNLARFFDVFCELQTWIQLKEMPNADESYVCSADQTFADRIVFQWQNHDFEIMEIPGHSKGGMGILLDGKEFFSGDSLMEDRPIELRFPGGSEKLWDQIGKARIEGLPKETRIRPGHFDSFIL